MKFIKGLLDGIDGTRSVSILAEKILEDFEVLLNEETYAILILLFFIPEIEQLEFFQLL